MLAINVFVNTCDYSSVKILVQIFPNFVTPVKKLIKKYLFHEIFSTFFSNTYL